MDCYMMRHGESGFNLPTIITDSFNRSNGNLGNADTGQAWLTGGAATTKWVVSSNVAKRASATTSVNDVAYIDCGKSDVIVSADITLTTSSSGSRLVARMSGTSVDNSMSMYLHPGGTVSIFRTISGSNSSIASAPFAFVGGSTYSCVFMCRGNVFSVYINGVLKVSAEDDNALKTNTRVGMFLPCSDTGTDWFDNFTVKG